MPPLFPILALYSVVAGASVQRPLPADGGRLDERWAKAPADPLHWPDPLRTQVATAPRRSLVGVTTTAPPVARARALAIPALPEPASLDPAFAEAAPPRASSRSADSPPKDRAPDRVAIESLGLSIRPPSGSVVARELVGGGVIGGTALLIAERPENPTWRLRIGALLASPDTPTAQTVAFDHVLRLRREGAEFVLLAEEPTRYGGVDGHLLVIQRPRPDGSSGVDAWLILDRGGLLFTVATLATAPEHLREARAALERSLATLELMDLDAVIAERIARLEAGEAFVASITPDRLRSLVGRDDWYRLYVPAGGASREREIGYLRIAAAEGKRGALNPGRPERDYTAEESETGLLVIAQSRGLLSDDASHVLDVEARYWLAWDRDREAWSSRSTERSGRDIRSFAQTGIRTPQTPGQPATLTVVGSRLGAAPTPADRPMEWSVPTQAYLSMPESLLLGQLLPRDAQQPMEFAFFAFDAKESRLPQRRDRWERSADGATWTLTTHPGIDEPPIVQLFDAAGNRIRRVDPDGIVLERIEPVAIQQLWKSKGLPTSDPEPQRPGREAQRPVREPPRTNREPQRTDREPQRPAREADRPPREPQRPGGRAS
ncbi:MAG TPA: hypothetical protein PKC43_03240 [Phycisphaerales bacterium]|nr:hypothetical protein [Phycisphaerales bacterium]HMP36443.1 hypothetical protein [Phycisphaerales bacterium]